MGRRFRHARRRAGLVATHLMGPLVVRLLSKTWTTKVLGAEHLGAARGEGGGHFMSVWHGRMVLGMTHHEGSGYEVLVSPSADGDISENILKRFGYGVIRGSSSRSGARALRAMMASLEGGTVLVITPDGPRGPRHSTNPGLAWMARATGYAIVPCGFVCDRAWRAASWDRFCVPKIGARLRVVYGEPVYVPREAQPEDLKAATELIRDRMLAAEQAGFDDMGTENDW
ncbi:MAG TPA: DUF374 domain-containing protein [Planctomycetes bacterium]|nr:DUF374 domain-containing protein [Planctomycetota bacterium]